MTNLCRIDDRPQPPPMRTEIAALVMSEAVGRAESLLAVLTMAPSPADGDLDWAMLPAHSLAGLLNQRGVPEASIAGEIVTALIELRAAAPAGRVEGAAALVGRIGRLRDELRGQVGEIPRTIALEAIADAAPAEIDRLAGTLGVALTTEVVRPEGVRVPAGLAGGVLDALGHILRDGVLHECARGGAIRIGFRREAEGFSITVGNRGNAASREAAPTMAARLGYDAAASRLSALGCVMAISDAPWGGTSVTVQVPLPH